MLENDREPNHTWWERFLFVILPITRQLPSHNHLQEAWRVHRRRTNLNSLIQKSNHVLICSIYSPSSLYTL